MFSETNVVIINQGPPGSAKSTKAREIKAYSEMNGLTCTICSADDYFINPNNNEYEFDITQLDKAHISCKDTFDKAIKDKVNRIIVDNTNVDLKAIRKYYDPNNGYKYKIVRPNTEWYFDAKECFRKNTHKVPLEVIRRMIESIKKFSLEDVRADIIWM